MLGPDEYDAYPWAEHPGLDDNAYTNVLASRVLARALDTVELLPDYRRDELLERLAIDHAELDRWHEVGRHLHVPFHDGVIGQFAGYERLDELDWSAYRQRCPGLQRLGQRSPRSPARHHRRGHPPGRGGRRKPNTSPAPTVMSSCSTPTVRP
ncbi:hypothetical protein [Kitasatospora acidiphila]|uniref:hypothetical protein n=1 Tax=Kitasatospora acidiphila TaxID=2567942 RepID=UPI003C7557C1